MINAIRSTTNRYNWQQAVIVVGVLLLAVFLGYAGSQMALVALVAIIGGLLLLRRLWLGLLGIIGLAMVIPMNISTGTDVFLNPVTLLIPAMFGLWLLQMALQQRIHFAPSRVNLPLSLFLGAGLLSLLIGNVLWDTAVPRSGSFWLVQLSQWALFAFSALGFWLAGNLIKNSKQLAYLTWGFLLLGGTLSLLLGTPLSGAVKPFTTVAFIRASFWVLLMALAAGQLLFNNELKSVQRLFLLALLLAVLVYAFVAQQEAASNWVGIVAIVGTLIWLRWTRLRVLIVLALLAMLMLGILFPAVYTFAGGDDEWAESGGSRLALIARVIEDTVSHNPVTGLGPAAYRAYGATRPLQYEHIVWTQPRISSHNNYVDLFAHTGIVGLALFFWFAAEYAWLGLRLRRRFTTGFTAAYVNSMLALGVGSLTIMLLADWILPFVYNIGFPGFQASVLVWLFLGGLIALEQMPMEEFNTRIQKNKSAKKTGDA